MGLAIGERTEQQLGLGYLSRCRSDTNKGYLEMLNEHFVEVQEVLLDQSGHKHGKPSFIVDQKNGFSTEESEDVSMPAL
jgi:hypothetical protein